jgi:Na+-driven multidrug efflux pump
MDLENKKAVQRDEALNMLDILSFYFPLILNASMMTLSTPFINFGIGRSPSSKEALAAFSTSFAITMVISSLTFSSRKVFTTHIKDKTSFHKILSFNLFIASACSIFCLFLGLTDGGSFFFESILKVPSNIIPYSKRYMTFIAVMPILNVFRIAFQSLVTIYRKTFLRAIATVIRLFIVIAVILVLTMSFPKYPVQAAALSLVFATIIEIVFLYIISSKYRGVPRTRYIKNYDFKLSNLYLFKFSFPFIITSVVRALMFSGINFFIGFTINPVEGLAGFGIVRSLILFTGIPIISLPTLVVLLADSEESFRKIKVFTFNLAIFSTFIVLFLSMGPIKRYLLGSFFNLSGLVYEITQKSFIYIAALPFFTTVRAFFEGRLLILKKPRPVGWSSLLRLSSLFVIGPIIISINPMIDGVFLGILLMIFSSILESFYIFTHYFLHKTQKINF